MAVFGGGLGHLAVFVRGHPVSLETDLAEIMRSVVREEFSRALAQSRAVDPLEYLTPEQVAELLKFDVKTVREKLSDGTWPGQKIEGKWRVQRLALEQHLAKSAANAAGAPDPDEAAIALARDIRGSRKAG